MFLSHKFLALQLIDKITRMTQLEHLQQFVKNTITNLEHIVHHGVEAQVAFELNCSDLEDLSDKNIRKNSELNTQLEKLKNIKGPVLYWIEIISEVDTQQLADAVNNYGKTAGSRTTSAVRKHIDTNSKILYVGKVKTRGKYSSRMFEHLGFSKTGATGALQIFHWAKAFDLKLRFHYMEFENNMADILPSFEYNFAKRLQPIIGKHK